MSGPVAYPVATSRALRDAYGLLAFGAIRPVTDVHLLCTSSSVSVGGEGRR